MKMRLIATATLASTLSAGAALAQDSPLSANISLVSDYVFRGISQTDQRPALQGGFDYAHNSGFYAGLWASNVSWLQDLGAENSSLEIDVYAGYAGEAGAIGYDFGLLQYYYPGSYGGEYRAGGNEKPHTLEGYVGISWQFLSFTWSYAFTDLFGIDRSRGSQYYDLSAAHELIAGVTLDAHVGYQEIRRSDSYTDWKLGLTKSYTSFDLGLHYVDTDISNASLADSRLVLSLAKTF